MNASMTSAETAMNTTTSGAAQVGGTTDATGTEARVRYAAYAAAILFAIRLPTFFVPALRDATGLNAPLVGELMALLGIAPHLLLFPVVAALPASGWARQAAYGWLVVDMATDIMHLGGVAPVVYLSLKYGGHLAAALWLASASWRAHGGMRVIGMVVALELAAYSFIAFVPLAFVVLLPSQALLPLWLALAGRRIAAAGKAEAEVR